MSIHKPLTAGEIEELRELEAKATPGPWEHISPQPPELWDARIFAGTRFVGMIGNSDNQDGCDSHNAALIAAMRNALPRLLSMLTPPPDAELREAVEHIGEVLDNVRCHLGICGPGDDGERKADASDNWGILDALDECRTLLRAVRAPRPSSEQHRVVRIAVINADLRGDTEESEALREAFPEAFAVEVGRG